MQSSSSSLSPSPQRLQCTEEQIREALSKFSQLQKVGQGTFADSVFKAYDIANDRWVALKIIELGEKSEEIEMLTSLRGVEHVISFFEHLELPALNKMVLVFEYMQFDLSGLMGHSKFEELINRAQVKGFMKQILTALANLDDRQIMHRDIKAANILINDDGIVKLADFGTATRYVGRGPSSRFHSEVCTLWYRPPELLLGETRYNSSIDIWATGCVFVELLTRCNFVRGAKDEPVSQLDAIAKYFGTSALSDVVPLQNLPHSNRIQSVGNYPVTNRLHDHLIKFVGTEGVSLLSQMLHFDPSQRLSARECLDHAFFKTGVPPQIHSLNNLGEIHYFEIVNNHLQKKALLQRSEAGRPQNRRQPSQGSPHESSPMELDGQSPSRKRPSPYADKSPKKRFRASPPGSPPERTVPRKLYTSDAARRYSPDSESKKQPEKKPLEKPVPPPPAPKNCPPPLPVPAGMSTTQILNPFFFGPRPQPKALVNPYLLPPVSKATASF